MSMNRRQALKTTGAAAAVIALGPLAAGAASAQARNEALFTAKTVNDAIKLLGGTPAESKDITITSPDIAENGLVVPVTVSTSIPKATEIYILVEKNPNALSAGFRIPDGTDAFVQTRVKMAQSSDIYAVVRAADGKLYMTKKETKVTLGGCGG
ncbi:MAG TPA: thiosulfate oxidation carrier protein SoxY [Burkholderiaceae bacterium]|nr:thiosulfate oxidation carrier protein SoxY [Burkholderiaceae bacterium]